MMAPALALLALAPVTLARTPKVDDRAVYAVRAVIDLGGQDDVRFSGTSIERVKAVADGLVTTAVGFQVSVDVMDVVRQSRAIESDRVERLDGTLVTASKSDSTLLFVTPRMDRLRAFYPPAKPVEIGAAWWHTEERRDDVKVPPFSSYLTFVGDEKVGNRDAWRVTFEASEAGDDHPAHVKGMVWLDKSDGSLVRGQWTLDGFTYGPNLSTGNARLELSRVETP